MNELTHPDVYGKLVEPATLEIRRLLPGTVERVWAYLTESELRRKWLASGEMEMKVGAPFELVWRNDELAAEPGERPDNFGEEERMTSRIIELDPPHRLTIGWGAEGEVTMLLAPSGNRVLLTIIHKRLPDRTTMLNVAAGWHTHLDMLAEVAAGTRPTRSFWDTWRRLKDDYDRLLPA
jgi:uncharacterized protein YndB with AHSA1/START domain